MTNLMVLLNDQSVGTNVLHGRLRLEDDNVLVRDERLFCCGVGNNRSKVETDGATSKRLRGGAERGAEGRDGEEAKGDCDSDHNENEGEVVGAATCCWWLE